MARLLKGRPPLPRYAGFRNVQVVLNSILQWGDTTSLSLKLQIVMLMSLARPSYPADSNFASLCIRYCHYKLEGALFAPSVLVEQSR